MTQTPKSWAAKDPDAVLDYVYTIPLDDGDSVSTYTLELLSGAVSIDSDSNSGADVTAWLSGGEDGETSVFRVAWVTVGGREDDQIITLAVVSGALTPLLLTDYMKPLPGHFVARYPAFADVSAEMLQYWLTDAERSVDSSWTEGDYAAGLMALAAHNMALAGLGTDVSAIGNLPAGITSLKSGSFSASFTEGAANARATGSFGSTRYGSEYLALLRRNRGGPRVTPTGVAPYSPYRYPHGEA